MMPMHKMWQTNVEALKCLQRETAADPPSSDFGARTLDALLPFAKAVTALRQAGKIHDSDMDCWQTMPFLRNNVSHPKSQSIWSRDTAAGQLAYTSELINRLFQ